MAVQAASYFVKASFSSKELILFVNIKPGITMVALSAFSSLKQKRMILCCMALL